MAIPRDRYSRVDGGYGWIIVFSSFLVHFILLGQVRTYGILYIDLLRIFDKSAAETATLSACFNTVRMLSAPLVSSLCKRTSCRFCLICGSIIMLIGQVASAFATSLGFLYFSYGVIGGLGASLLFTPPYIIIGQYFDVKKGLAMALGTVGAGLGAVVFAPVTAFLLKYYGYRGCMLILGACTFHNCVAGALLRPFEAKPISSMEMVIKGSTASRPSIYNGPEPKVGWTEEERIKLKGQTVIDNSEATVGSKSTANACDCVGNEDVMISNTKDTQKKRSCVAVIKKKSYHMLRGFKKCLLLFKNRTMIIYCLCIVMLPVAFGMLVFFMADAAVLLGASTTDASLLMSIFGGCDVIGRLCWGFIIDLQVFRHRRRMVFSLLGIISGFIIASIGLIHSYVGYAIITAVFGVFSGGFHSQRMTVVSEFIPKERLPDIVGISIFFQGMGSLIGSPFGGFVRDATGNYDIAFHVCGLGLTVSCALFLVDYIIKDSTYCNKTKQETEQN